MTPPPTVLLANGAAAVRFLEHGIPAHEDLRARCRDEVEAQLVLRPITPAWNARRQETVES